MTAACRQAVLPAAAAAAALQRRRSRPTNVRGAWRAGGRRAAGEANQASMGLSAGPPAHRSTHIEMQRSQRVSGTPAGQNATEGLGGCEACGQA